MRRQREAYIRQEPTAPVWRKTLPLLAHNPTNYTFSATFRILRLFLSILSAVSSGWQIPRDSSVPAGSLNFRYSQFPFLFPALLFITLFILVYLSVPLYLQFVSIASPSFRSFIFTFVIPSIEIERNKQISFLLCRSIDFFLASRGKSSHLSSFVNFFIFSRVSLAGWHSLQPISLFRADRKSSGSESLSVGRSTSCGEII